MIDELEQIKNLIEEVIGKLKYIRDEYGNEEEYVNPEPKIKEGDVYWAIDGRGHLYDNQWENDLFDGDVFEIGNVFKTEAEAKFMVEKLKVIQELKQLARPFKPDASNWLIQYDNELDFFVLKPYKETVVSYGDFYFDDNEEAHKAISKIGEGRIKKYLFGVD